jgi:hypothetical protein
MGRIQLANSGWPLAARTGTSASRPAGRPAAVVDPVQVDRRYRRHVLQVHLRLTRLPCRRRSNDRTPAKVPLDPGTPYVEPMPLLAVDESLLARISEEHWKQRSSMSARLAPIQSVGPEAAVNGVDLPHKIDGEPAGVKRFRLVQGRAPRRFHGVANLMPLRSCRCPETWLRWNETVRSLPGRQSAHLPMARIALSTLGRYGSGTRYSSRLGGCSNLPRDRVALAWICNRPGS